MIDVEKAFFKGRLHKPIYIYIYIYIWAPDGHASFEKEIWSVLLPIYEITTSSRLFYQRVSEFFRLIGMGHFMGGPCLFRRLEGPGIQYPYPEHTDTKDWRWMAPNQRFEGHHVEQLSSSFKHCLPTPNILEERLDLLSRNAPDRLPIESWHVAC